MKTNLKFASLFASILISLLAPNRIANAQRPNFELDCPAGTTPVAGPSAATFNPTTGKFRQNLCIDANGNIVYIGLRSRGPIPWFDVTAYGTVGNTQMTRTASSTNGSNTVTNSVATWVASDVGKSIWGYQPGSATALPLGTITAVSSSTSITVSVAATFTGTLTETAWGTDDTKALASACAASNSNDPPGIVFVPPGGYMVSGQVCAQKVSTSVSTSFIGSGGIGNSQTANPRQGSTIFYLAPNSSIVPIFDFGLNPPRIGNFAFDAVGQGNGASIIRCTGCGIAEDIQIVQVGNIGSFAAIDFEQGANIYINRVQAANEAPGQTGIPFYLNAVSSGVVSASGGSNSTDNVVINGSGTVNPIVWRDSESDEGNGIAAFRINGSKVTLENVNIYSGGTGAVQPALYIDGTSIVTVINSIFRPFGAETNRDGIQILAGGIINAFGSTFTGTGAGHYGIVNAGTFNDLGGNTWNTINNTGSLNHTLTNQQLTVASRNTALVGTKIIAITNPGVTGVFHISLYAYDSALGVGCTGNTTVTWTIAYTDLTNTSQIQTATETITGNGNATGGDGLGTTLTIGTNDSGTISASTTYTIGVGCTTGPSYAASLRAY